MPGSSQLALSLSSYEHLHRPLNPTLQTQNLFMYVCMYVIIIYITYDFSTHLMHVLIQIVCKKIFICVYGNHVH